MVCLWCEEKEIDDSTPYGLCDTCLDDHVYCAVCDEMLHIDEALYRHRHVFYDQENCEWLGTGGDCTEHRLDDIKESFFEVLTKTQLSHELEVTIKKQQMGFNAIHFSGDCLGYTGVWCWLYADEDQEHGTNYGDRFTDNLDHELEEKMGFGVLWLISLDNEHTRSYNELTLQWIAEWEKRYKK